MGDRTMRPVQSPTPFATTSSQFTRMPPISAGPCAPSRPHHPHPSVPSSPESLVIRSLKKHMNRLDLNARIPSSSYSGPPTIASAGIGTGTGPHGNGAATTMTSAAAAALQAATKVPTSKPSTHTNCDRNNNNNNNNNNNSNNSNSSNSNNSNNNHDNNSSSAKKSSRRHKKDRSWKNGPPATLAPLLHPSSLHHLTHNSQHHHRHHHGQERTGGDRKTRLREGSFGSGHGDGLIAGGGEGGSNATEGPSGGRKSTGNGGSGVHGGGGGIVSCGGGTITEATAAFGSGGNSEGRVSAGGGGGGGREGRKKKKDKESGGIGRKRLTKHHTTTPNNIRSSQPGSGWMPSGVGAEDSDYGEGQDDSRGYQMGPMENGTGVGMGVGMGATAGGGVGYSSSSLAGIKEPESSPALQYYHHQQDHQSRHQYGYQQQNQQQYQQSPHEHLHQHLHQRHQQHQMEQQIRQAADFYPRQQHAQLLQEQYQQGQKQQEPGAPDKAIRSSFLQGIKTHALQPTQLTHLTLLRYEFLMNEFVEMMRLLPALQVLDLDVTSVPSCSCRTFSRPYARHHQQQQQQQQQQQASRHHHHSPQSLHNWSQNSGSFQQPEDPSFLQQPFRASPYTEAQYLRESSQNDDGDDMDIDSGESNQASAVALCSSCIRREGLFRHNQCSSSPTAGPQDQFPTVRSLTFRGTAIVPEIIALFPNLETLAFEEMRSKTPTPTISLPSVPGDALIHGSTNSRAHGRMGSSQSHSEFGSSSFYTESGDDSLDATASLSLEAELPGPPSRQSVMISELAIMLKNHCPLLTRLVLNEPLLVEDLSREQLRLQNNSLSSTIGDQSPSLGSSHTYPVDNQQQSTGASRGQDQLALLLQVIPCLKQFVAHSRVVAKCPQLLDTLLEYHHPHLVSFQVLDDSQDMSHYPSIQNPNATPVMPHLPQHHAFYSTQDIYEHQSPHQQQQHYEQQGYQYLPTFVPCEKSPAMQQQQQQQYDYLGVGGNGLPGSPSAQPSSLLHQALQTQHYLQQLQRQQTILRLQGSSFRILESCPNLQVFESKIPLPLQRLIGSVPRWACGSEITVLWLEIQELTGDSGLDPEEEEVMQMFVKSLFKGSRSNTASSSPPQEMTSSGGGEGDSSRLTTVSPSPLPPPPPPPPLTGAATAPGIVCDGLSPCASVGDMVSATATSPGFRSYLVEVGSSGTDLSSLESVVPVAAAAAGGGSETFPSPSPPLDIWASEGPHQQQPVLSAVNIVSPAAATGTSPEWNKPLAPPPPPLAFTSPATISLTMGGGGGGASYTSGPCHIEGIERLVALQFLVEHQLVYLPKLDRFLVGNCVYTIPTRERVF